MEANYGGNALSFLINTLVDIYVTVIAVRFLMQMVQADYYSPVAQFVVKVSNPLLMPLRRIVPGFGGQDMAALLLCWLLFLAKLALLSSMALAINVAGYHLITQETSLLSLMILAAVDLLGLFFSIFFFSLIVQALLSWINPGNYNPVTQLLYQINAPLLKPVQRLIPPISGIDLSLIALLLGLQLLKMLLIPPLLSLA
ncbi:MAG: YggT family protein [Gammaproteobacteria bacterium]|nr:YggT family protein [Gammaproteobacteria bacterium]